MTFISKVEARVDWDWRDGAVDGDSLRFLQTLEDGSDAYQSEAVWHDTNASLTSGSTRTLDLTALTRTVLGQAIDVSFDKIRAILIQVDADSTGTLVFGDAATDTWYAPLGTADDTIRIGPGSPLLIGSMDAGWSVGSSAKNLLLTAQGGAVTYSITIIGTLV